MLQLVEERRVVRADRMIRQVQFVAGRDDVLLVAGAGARIAVVAHGTVEVVRIYEGTEAVGTVVVGTAGNCVAGVGWTGSLVGIYW